MSDMWIVRNRESGRIESNIVTEQQAREYAEQANTDHQTDAYTAVPWNQHPALAEGDRNSHDSERSTD